ncbi:MAG: MMPL family transporter [Chitinophagaceae bacterium]|nr:MMPL family transporter [Chitinophagaceae bacterium]
MWQKLARFVLRNRVVLLIILFASTVVMGYFASQVKLSYEFAKAIPTDNPKYKEYQAFRDKFGDDGNLLVIAIESDKIFELNTFNSFAKFQEDLKNVPHVEDVLSIVSAVNLTKDSASEKLVSHPIFTKVDLTQERIDSGEKILFILPFYKTLLYNPVLTDTSGKTNAYITAVRINKDVLNSAGRTEVVNNIIRLSDAFTTNTKIQTHLSGLPLIRTLVANRIAKELRWFLLGSLALSAFILLIFFRSVSTAILSLLVVIIGVIWGFGILELFHYKITLLNALIPPLIVVIGIPNCIYFLNKYHSTYRLTTDKNQSLVDMVSKMGVVTLFCNLTAAIGFAVFAFTKSSILKEFGAVAGISIMMIFVISFILLPAVLSFLPVPKAGQTKYLDNRWLTALLLKIEQWVMHHKTIVYAVTLVVLIFSVAGIFRLQSEGFIVDDLPKTDKIYTDLKYFEKNFKGVMPLEIVVDTKKRYGLAGARALPVMEKIDSLSQYITAQNELARPLSIAEGLKFVKQAFYDGDTANYSLPNSFDAAFVGQYLKPGNDSSSKNNLTKLLTSFMDTARQSTRVSINMADVGTKRLPVILEGIQQRANTLFDSSKYKVTLTGTSITFLEGSRFIINGLKESIGWAFLLIALCMLYLFKSVRILFCSLIPNVIPLIVTAGIMGWAGIRLKPSTVLVFSVALGIAIDVTIRFLVNYKQELPQNKNNVVLTVSETIKHTGLSILYTSMVLVAGFIIFCFSGFGGTQALGWLTSVTLFVATITNLVLLPVLLMIGNSPTSSKNPISS